MRIPLNSVKQFTDITISNEELIEKVFTQIGAVEEIEDLNKKYSNIFVAQIVKKEDHPDSEKLAVYQVQIGKGKVVQIVTGDRTLEIGDKVAYFSVGAKLPFNPHPEKNEDVVTKIKLRGVDSEGMLASQKELNLGNDHTRILRLQTEAPVGELFSKAYMLDDVVLDIENKALANRGDCFGILGVARELAAIQGLKFQSPKWYIDSKSNMPEENTSIEIEVDNQTQINCPRYTAIVLDNITVAQSPLWMQIELTKAGIRSINNVVDVTNYMMILTSQPIHAFDYDKVLAKSKEGKVKIVIRQAQDGEKLLALNDKVLELDSSMTVICDSQTPIALAGIIGGKDTEVDENTKRIILEVANFNRYNIRKTSWKLGVFTDAATRYTKALSSDQCEPVSYQAVKLLQENANAKVASRFMDAYPTKNEPKSLDINIDELNRFVGLHLTKEEVVKILENLEYLVKEDKTGNLNVTVPFFREDINIVEDIYEDIARIYGYNTIKVTLPNKSIQPPAPNHILDIKSKLREILSNSGANEILTYNFVSQKDITNFNLNLENTFQLKNPLSPDLEFMRQNLLPSIALKVRENIERGYNDQVLYEMNIGHNKLEKNSEGLPLERWNLTLVTTSGYYSAKVYLDLIQSKLNLYPLQFTLICNSNDNDIPTWITNIRDQYNQNRSAYVTYQQEGKKFYLGVIGELSNTIIFNNNLPTTISAFELDIEQILKAQSPVSKYQEPSKFPKITRDHCFVMNKDIQYGAIKEEIEDILKKSGMYYEIELIDIYSSEKMSDTKQMTFRISLQSRDKTMEGWEYDKVMKKVMYLLNEKFQANII